MHAHASHITTVTTIDDCEGVGGEIVAKKTRGGFRKLVLLFARAVTSAAANAECAVEEDGLLRYRLSVHFFTYGPLSGC